MTDDWTPIELAADDVSGTLDELVERSLVAMRHEVDAYSGSSDLDLAPLLRRNFAIAFAATKARRNYTADELSAIVTTVAARARQGFSLDAVLQGFSVAGEISWHELCAAARRHGAADHQLVAMAELRSTLFESLVRELARAHRDVELQLTAEAQQRATAALQSLLEGKTGDVERSDSIRRLGLDPHRPHWLIRARPSARGDVTALSRRLAQLAPRSAVMAWGDDAIALLPVSPVMKEAEVIAGVAGPVDLADASVAFEEATRAFETALAFGLHGQHTVRDLGLWTAVIAQPAVTELLRVKYLEPLSGNMARELLATVKVYLGCGSRRDVAGELLHLHPNTVAYRVRRFAALTGVSLDDHQTLAELWWLFRAEEQV